MITTSDFLAAIGVLAAMLSLLFIVGEWAKRHNVAPETKRKLIHVSTGLVSLSFPWLFSGPLPVLLMVAAAIGFMIILRTPFVRNRAVANVLHDVKRQSYGEFYLLFAVGFLFARAYQIPVLYVLPLAIIALSDTASALVGTNYGRRFFFIGEGKKSLEGGVAFFVVTLILSLILLILLSDIADINVVVLSIMVALFCALMESDSWEGLDNLFVPIGAYILLVSYMDAAPLVLVWALITMIAASFIIPKYGEKLGLTGHGARAFSLLIILFIAGTANQFPLFPLLAIVAYWLARKTDPKAQPRRDLEMVAVSASVAMIWLFLDGLTPLSAINLYNLTYASAALLFFGLALQRKWRFLALLIAVPLGMVYLYFAYPDAEVLIWQGDLRFLMGGTFALAVGFALFFPQFFNRFRVVRVYSVAGVLPLCAYLYEMTPQLWGG